MMRILTATGGSRHAARAVRLACRLGSGPQSSVTVLTVIDPRDRTDPVGLMQNAKTVAREVGVPITTEEAVGRVSDVIEAKTTGYELLVIGARGTRSVRDFFLGENAIRLAKDTRIPTLIVRRQARIRRVLWRLPFGQREEMHESLMCQMLKAAGAEEIVLLVVEAKASMFGFDRDMPQQNLALVCETEDALAQLRQRIRDETGLTAGCLARTGIPEEVILDEAAKGGYDLIAVSQRRRRGLGRLFAEDLPFQVARSAPVSVLLLR